MDVQYIEKLNELHKDLLFSPERMKIGKVEKPEANLHDKTEYLIHIRKLKQALNHGLILKKGHKVIKFNQNGWLKPCIDINRDLRKKEKIDFGKDFFKMMNNAVFGKTMENVRNIKKRELFSIRTKFSYYKVFHRNFISNRNEKNLDMKNCYMILTEKQQRYQHYRLEKLINMNILQVKKHFLLIREK